MDEFYGRFINVLDNKGRINLPARFRGTTDSDENGEQTFILTKGTEQCIAMVPVREWRRKLEALEVEVPDGEKRRILKRRINYNASHQKVDKQGRINIPSELIEYARLGKEVVVLGTGKMIEIWNPKGLENYLQSTESDYQEQSSVLDF